VRIGKAYLAGTAKEVWVPDLLSQERRDWMHAHRKAVTRTTQMHNRIASYLSDNGVRPDGGLLPEGLESLRGAKAWSPRQWSVLEGMFMELGHAQQQRAHWVSLMAQEVLQDPLLLSLTRLCGVRDITAFALGAIIGDIHRFSEPKKLVKYVGLDPAFDDSGENTWSGGIGGHGRRDLRALVIESAHAILRTDHPLAKWGKRLLGRKGEIKVAVAAVARKLVVAVWYLMMGRATPLEEIDDRLALKVGKMINQVGSKGLETLGQTRAQLRTQVYDSLKNGRDYVLDWNKKMEDKPEPPVGEACALDGSKAAKTAPGGGEAKAPVTPAPKPANKAQAGACDQHDKGLQVSASGAKRGRIKKTEREGDASQKPLLSLSKSENSQKKKARPSASGRKMKN
jgi:hypothetical protein